MESEMTQEMLVTASSRITQNPAPRTLTHTVKIADPSVSAPAYGKKTILMRQVIGEELRRRRNEQSRTLRDVSRDAQVSLGYLSELERGQKEASSELLAAICSALDTPLSSLLAGVSAEVAKRESMISDRAQYSIA
jgi:predicted transcriptional regulator